MYKWLISTLHYRWQCCTDEIILHTWHNALFINKYSWSSIVTNHHIICKWLLVQCRHKFTLIDDSSNSEILQAYVLIHVWHKRKVFWGNFILHLKCYIYQFEWVHFDWSKFVHSRMQNSVMRSFQCEINHINCMKACINSLLFHLFLTILSITSCQCRAGIHFTEYYQLIDSLLSIFKIFPELQLYH
jgi:hypothetical protein